MRAVYTVAVMCLMGTLISCTSAGGQPLLDGGPDGQGPVPTRYAAEPADLVAISHGDWSEPVNGLQARVVLKRTHVTNGMPMIRAYLELKNVTDRGNPMIVAWASEKMTARVLDAEGDELAPSWGPYSGRAFGSHDLTLPHDSSLIFSITMGGAGIPADRAGMIDLGPLQTWVIPTADQDYHLHTTFTVPQNNRRRDETGWFWHGALAIPGVRLPLDAVPIDPDRVDHIIDALSGIIFEGNSSEAERAIRLLSLVDDPRVVPVYVRMMDLDRSGFRYTAMDRLSRFDGDDAFAGLRKGMALQAEDVRNSATQTAAEGSAAGLRHKAAVSLRRSPHPEAEALLLSMHNDPHPAVRITVAQAAAQMTSPESLDILRGLATDEDERVRNEAARLLKIRDAEHHESTVPAWFKPDPDDPHAVFSAWRNLSTHDAVLYWGPGWRVVAGVLRDENGDPISDALLHVSHHDGLRTYFAHLRTDAQGHFIIYSPVGSSQTKLGELAFRAARGHPFTHSAVRYASTTGNLVACNVRIVQVAEDRHFFILTAPDQPPYDKDAHRAFQEKELAEWADQPRRPFSIRPYPREGRDDGGLRNTYTVRIVSPDGKGVAGAVIRYIAYDGVNGNNQAIATDETGTATLVEVLAADQEQKYYDEIRRFVAVDIPGQAVGPVPFNFDPDKITIIATGQGGRVSGRVVDHNGEPLHASLVVEYTRPNMGVAGFGTTSGPDGRFTIDRIMPGEPFRIRIPQQSHQTTPMPEVWSFPITLDEAQHHEGLNLTVPKPAAIRGVVLDEHGQPVEGIWNLTFRNEHGAWSHGEPAVGRFGSFAMAPGPLRIKVQAKGFEPYLSDEILLKPGGMAFVNVVMQKSTTDARAEER